MGGKKPARRIRAGNGSAREVTNAWHSVRAGTTSRRTWSPLERSVDADRFGVSAPRAIVLFGPTGTGKTTFAKAIASRLGWPFVEMFPSRLAADSPGGLAAALQAMVEDFAADIESFARL